MVSNHCNHHAILGWFWHAHPAALKPASTSAVAALEHANATHN